MSRDGERVGGGVTCRRVDDLKLAIGSFPLKRWKKGWSDEWVNGVVGRFGTGGDSLADGGPHAASASGTDGDIGVSMLRSENEEWVDGFVINVEDVLSAG